MISIIIPTYDSQDTISKCINSILNINSICYEIILVDDGSKDNTPEINDKYSNKYLNVYSIHQHNRGVSEARNNGIRHAQGKWICFIDSDDFINARNFVKVVKLYANQQNDLIVSSINFNGKYIGLKNDDVSIYEFLKLNYPLYGNELIHVVWNKIYKTSIIKENNINFPRNIEMGEDLIFVLRYLMHIHHYVIQTKIYYYIYYIHSSSTTKSFEHNSFKSRLLILQNIKRIYIKYKLSNKSINKLKLKAIYSILLNALNKSHSRIRYLISEKKIIDFHSSQFNVDIKHDNDIEDIILFYIFKQPFIIILLCFLYIINIFRKIIFITKYKF